MMSTAESALSATQQKAFETKVKEALWSYDELDKKLRNRVRDYLIDGEDGTCLLELDAAFSNDKRKKFFRQQHGTSRAKDRVERKKLYGLFLIKPVAPGYFRRLGEVAGHIPEVRDFQRSTEDIVAPWLCDVLKLRFLLSTDSHVFHYSYNSGKSDGEFELRPFFADLEEPEDAVGLIQMTLASEQTTYDHIARYLARAADWPGILAQHPRQVGEGLKSADAHGRESAIEWLNARKFDYEPILDVVAELTVSSSKKVRLQALNVLRKSPERAAELLAERLAGGNASERGHAAEALVAVAGPAAEPRLAEALKKEKGKRVKQTLESLLATFADKTTEASEAVEEVSFDLPPIHVPIGEVPLPPEFADEVWQQTEAMYDKWDQKYERDLATYKSPDRPKWMSKPNKASRIEKKVFNKAMDYIAGKLDKRPRTDQFTRNLFYGIPLWNKWTDLTKLELVHVVRFMDVFDLINYHGENVVYLNREDLLDAHRNEQAEPYGLREVDATFAACTRFDPGAVARTYLQMNNSWQTFLDWDGDSVWPVFAEHIDVFRDSILGTAFSGQRHDYYVNERRRMAMKVAAMMPALPMEIENTMWSVALGEGKSDRPAARRALHTAKNPMQRTLNALADGKQGIRTAAAEMLHELGDESAIEPLKKALKKEKQEIVKGAMLQAIEALGGDVDEFLGRRKQLNDAKKGLEKKRPKGMEWVPLDSLPKVRWAEDDKPVNNEILQWWVIQSIQFKLPTCGPILRRSLGMCRKDDASGLAKHVLSNWIAYDTSTPPQEEIVAKATKEAAKVWNSKHGSWMKQYYKTEEAYRAELISQMQNTFVNSAIGQKGMLAIVSAAGDAECVKMIERYIRTYHGHRLAQSKALLETLGWIDDGTAVQLLLSLGNRFRTKAIRKRAAELVQELADRQGWTMDQLADRTIPDAGFTREEDEDGKPIGDRAELVVDYGSRKFSIVLGDDLQAVITRDDGKQVKSLPSPAKDDDPDLVKAAKKEFSAAKKTIKETVKNQAERLYEAACVQRSWPADEWKTYLADHPIAGALCRRVIWAAQSPDESEPPRLFRPLEDGTLTDVSDDEFELGDDDRVLVAHSSLLDEETEEAWKQHLEDYEVPELFKQFGRETYRLPESLEKETEINDFCGHMLTTFRLRSRATKLGWVRGDAEDGGSFGLYHKPFRSQGVDAIIDFTGSYLPEEDIPAGLRELYFVPIKPNDDGASSWNPKKLKLGKVPPVLISECYNDVRDMAAEGTGYDPEWEKKGLW